jgi:hypothetical protein
MEYNGPKAEAKDTIKKEARIEAHCANGLDTARTPSSFRKALSVMALHPFAGAVLQSHTWWTVGPH